MTRFGLSLTLMLMSLAVGSLTQAQQTKRIALVFDDGPVPTDATPLLAILAREHVAASFSLVGERVLEHPAMARMIVAAGHELNNHSQRHLHPHDLTDAVLAREIARAQAEITAAAGVAPRWYWPPFLEVDDRVRAAAAAAGIKVYVPRHLVVAMDYDRGVPAEAIYRHATTGVTDGTVILMHEWRRETRDELPAILAELRRQGCQFYTFSALFDALTK